MGDVFCLLMFAVRIKRVAGPGINTLVDGLPLHVVLLLSYLLLNACAASIKGQGSRSSVAGTASFCQLVIVICT
jgi:hypothetical protein